MASSPTTAFSRDRLRDTFARLGARADDALFDELHRAYSSPDRHYHDVRHVDACLRTLADFAANAHRLAEVVAALYFHDAIYDTHRDDNEARSADWARAALQNGGARADVADRVHALILATRHAAPADDPDVQLVVDVDLGILGQSPAEFARYDADIRCEYHWVAWDAYVTARTAVLERLLARERIYATRSFYDRFEAQARYNIASAIAQLARRHTPPP